MTRKSAISHLLLLLLCLDCPGQNPTPALKDGVVTDPLGEWYEVGYKMAAEAAPGFRTFGVSETDGSLRLSRIIETLGVNTQGIKLAELKALQEGWDDSIAGKKQAMTFPADQRGSLVPPALRGFHPFADSSSGELADRAVEWRKSVVLIKTDSKHGTGFFIGPGLVVTNQHVIKDAEKIEVVHAQAGDVQTYEARVIADQKDVALLSIEWKQNPALPLGDSDTCKELQEVVMIGYPKYVRVDPTFVKGHISATKGAEDIFDQERGGDEFKGLDMLQINIETASGNSGGPVFDSLGNVVGILTSGISTYKQFSFAQKINFVMPFIEKHAKGKFERLR